VRKTVSVDAMAGLAAETLLMLPFGIAYLAYCEVVGTGAIATSSVGRLVLLVSCGPVTAIPLWLFAYGARRIAYSTVGLVQYIGPTLQLLIGIFFMHELFSPARAVGFAFIWLALLIYATDSLILRTRARSPS
jgi:chloramphenicol-sensitive protein RarD